MGAIIWDSPAIELEDVPTLQELLVVADDGLSFASSLICKLRIRSCAVLRTGAISMGSRSSTPMRLLGCEGLSPWALPTGGAPSWCFLSTPRRSCSIASHRPTAGRFRRSPGGI